MSLRAGVRKRFGTGDHAFGLDVDVALAPGVTILFGRSGSGKTTLLQCVAGLLRPEQGRIEASGTVLFDSAAGVDVPAAGRNIGYVFQELALFPHLTAEKNAAFGLAGVPAAERSRRVGEIFERFHIGHVAARMPSEISGGERQRVALARALVTRPRALLLDEPLSALDAPIQSSIMADLREWNRDHPVPVLYVTHSRREAFALGEQVLVLEQGRIVAGGSPHQVLDVPEDESIAHLAGFENVFAATVSSRHPAQGTMTCHLEGSSLELEAPLGPQAEGGRVRLGIRAGDILLAGARPSGLSARNLLPGRVESLTPSGTGILARVECGQQPTAFQVLLTPGAVDSLGLRPGAETWLVIKTWSCRVMR